MKRTVCCIYTLTLLISTTALAQSSTEDAMGDVDAAMQELNRALRTTDEALDEAADAVDEAGRAVDEAGREVDQATGGEIAVDASGVAGVAAASPNVGRTFRNEDFEGDHRGVDFSGAIFINPTFEDGDFTGASFVNAKISNGDFRNVNLTNVCFGGAILRNTDFDTDTVLDGTNMTGSVRSNTEFEAGTRGVIFDGTPCGGLATGSSAAGGLSIRADLTRATAIIASLSGGKDATIDLTVNFRSDSDKVLGQARAQVLEIANALKSSELEGQRILIEGHTDSVGDDEYNLDLSYRRSIAVMRMLNEEYGIPSAALSVKGFGETQPLTSNDSESGRAINRRVTLRNLGG